MACCMKNSQFLHSLLIMFWYGSEENTVGLKKFSLFLPLSKAKLGLTKVSYSCLIQQCRLLSQGWAGDLVLCRETRSCPLWNSLCRLKATVCYRKHVGPVAATFNMRHRFWLMTMGKRSILAKNYDTTKF